MSQTVFVMRNIRHLAVTGRDCLIFCGPGLASIWHPTSNPRAWSALLQSLILPSPRDPLRDSANLPPDCPDGFLDVLIEAGYLWASTDPQELMRRQADSMATAPALHLAATEPRCQHLLIGCCGSIAAGLLPQTFLSLYFSGFQSQLDVILTSTAARFLSRELLEAYGIRCWQDGFERQGDIRVPHVNLGKSADIICVLPATADSLARLARSACNDLLSLTITSTSAPLLLAPVMNATMWNNAGVQRNVAQLRADGHFVLEPSLIIGAADFAPNALPMYGGHGCLWSGPAGLMAALEAVLCHAAATDQNGAITPHPSGE